MPSAIRANKTNKTAIAKATVWDVDAKHLLVDQLSTAYSRLNFLLLLAHEDGLVDEAAQLSRRKDRLGMEIETLSSELLTTWVGDAAQISATLALALAEVQRCVDDVQHDGEIAQQVAKAIGSLDRVIALAGKVLS